MLPVPSDFCVGITLDNSLLLQDIVTGKPIPLTEVLSLGSAAQTIFITTVLESRKLDRVQDQYLLWRELFGLFNELCKSWADAGSNEESITWLLARLRHFRDLAEDRCAIFSISEKERIAHSKIRADAALAPIP